MDGRSELTSPSPRGLTHPRLGCTWDALPVLEMEGVKGEEEGGIGTGTEGGRIGDMEAGEMTTAGGGLHLHTGGGEAGAGPDHSHQEERDINNDRGKRENITKNNTITVL